LPRFHGKPPTILHHATKRKRRAAIVDRVTELRAGVTARRKQVFATVAATRPAMQAAAARNMRRLQPAMERVAKVAQRLGDIQAARSQIEPSQQSDMTQNQKKTRRARMR